MLKRFVFMLCFGVFGVANAEMLIKQNLSVSVEVEATKYVSFISVSGNEALRKLKTLNVSDKNAIIKTYNNINEFLGKESICKGGSFEIQPIYEYKNNQRIQNGFTSNYGLNCEFFEAQKEDYDKILRKIENEVQKNPYLLFALPSVEKVLDEKSLTILDEQLNVKLLELALQKAKEYSNLSRHKCTIKEINLGAFAEEVAVPTMRKMNLSMAKSEAQDLASVSLPTAKNTQKTAQGNVVFSCR